MAGICLPRLNTSGSDYKHSVKKYKCIHTYPPDPYLFSRFIHDSPFERINMPSSCPYDLFLANEFISKRENQSLHAKELNAIHESKIHKETLKLMFNSNDKENGNISESDEELLQYKPHHPRFMTPLCHVTASSASGDLIVIHTSTTKDINLKALDDSGATTNCCSDSYVRENYSLRTHSSTPFAFD